MSNVFLNGIEIEDKLEFKVGDLITNRLRGLSPEQKKRPWIGLVLEVKQFYYSVFVLRNDQYPDQVGTVTEWVNKKNHWKRFKP